MRLATKGIDTLGEYVFQFVRNFPETAYTVVDLDYSATYPVNRNGAVINKLTYSDGSFNLDKMFNDPEFMVLFNSAAQTMNKRIATHHVLFRGSYGREVYFEEINPGDLFKDVEIIINAANRIGGATSGGTMWIDIVTYRVDENKVLRRLP